MGLLGVLIAAIIAGLSNRMPALVIADLQGAQGFSSDDASWLTSAYAAGELAAMPFAGWFAVTFSLRRFHLAMLGSSLVLAAIIPSIQSLELMVALRVIHGLVSGAMIPLLMMAALRFLPLSIRLHGLALYALTATFAPNVALWFAAQCVDALTDWRWVFWAMLPLGAVSMALVAYGVPKSAANLSRMRGADWMGMALGMPGLALLVIGIDQGVRLDWLNSPIVSAALFAGASLTALFLLSEWFHPQPFMQLQLLGRRNLGLGFSVFFVLLMVMTTSVGFPANALGQQHGFRLEQTASLGLVVALPQLVLGPLVALLLYQRWVDARYVFATGLLVIALACWNASGFTSLWIVKEFLPTQSLFALGQPMAVVSLLFLATSVVKPPEGPSVSGLVNTLRALGSGCGAALIGELLALRQRFHSDMLLDAAGSLQPGTTSAMRPTELAAIVAQQAGVLAAADVYRVFAVMALLLIPVVLRLNHIPAPSAPHPDRPDPQPATSTLR